MLFNCHGNGDMYVCEATSDQVDDWTSAFLEAVDYGTADATDPVKFALLIPPVDSEGRDTA